MENIRPVTTKVVAAAAALGLACVASMGFAATAHAQQVAGVALDHSSLTVQYGQSAEVNATVSNGAGTASLSAEGVVWSAAPASYVSLSTPAVSGNVSKVSITGAEIGTSTVTASFTDVYGTAKTGTVSVTVTKANQSITLKDGEASGQMTFKYKNIKKKAKTATIKATGAKEGAKTTFAKASGNSKIKVAKSGKVTFKKGMKKGTYKFKVKATTAATTHYKKATTTKTYKVYIK